MKGVPIFPVGKSAANNLSTTILFFLTAMQEDLLW